MNITNFLIFQIKALKFVYLKYKKIQMIMILIYI